MTSYQGDVTLTRKCIAESGITGGLTIAEGCTIDASNLVYVDGPIYLGPGVTLIAPLLCSAGGYLSGKGARLTAPRLKVITGGLHLEGKLTAPRLHTIERDVFLFSRDNLTLSELRKIGGNLFVSPGKRCLMPRLASVGSLRTFPGSDLVAPLLVG